MNVTAECIKAKTEGFSPRMVALSIRPSGVNSGEYTFETDRYELIDMLRKKTELRLSDLDRFKEDLSASRTARLFRVEMSERALTEIGYFVD